MTRGTSLRRHWNGDAVQSLLLPAVYGLTFGWMSGIVVIAVFRCWLRTRVRPWSTPPLIRTFRSYFEVTNVIRGFVLWTLRRFYRESK